MNRDSNVKTAYEQLDSYEMWFAKHPVTEESRQRLVETRANVVKALGKRAEGVTDVQVVQSPGVFIAFRHLALAEEDLRDYKGSKVAQMIQKVMDARSEVEKKVTQFLEHSAAPHRMGVRMREPEVIHSSGGAAEPARKKRAGPGDFVDLTNDSD